MGTKGDNPSRKGQGQLNDLLSIPVTSFNGRKTRNALTAGWSNDGNTNSINLFRILQN